MPHLFFACPKEIRNIQILPFDASYKKNKINCPIDFFFTMYMPKMHKISDNTDQRFLSFYL